MGAEIVNFITMLNQRLNTGMTDAKLAEVIDDTAKMALLAAMSGKDVVDGLNRNQAGALLAIIQWNHNPVIRAGVKAK